MKLTQEQAALADGLNGRQKLFVFGLMSGKTQRQAYYDAGGTAKTDNTADACASEILSNPKVKAFYDSLMDKAAEEAQVDAAYVLKRLVEIDQMDVLDIMDDNGNVKPIKDWPKIWRQYISNIETISMDDGEGWLKKIKWPDKVKNLELLGKHVSVGAFKDKIEHTGPNGGPIQQEIKEVPRFTPEELAKLTPQELSRLAINGKL